MAQAITYHGFHNADHSMHPDPTRVGALGATMALNLGALLLLAMPMQGDIAPQALVNPPRTPLVEIVERRPPPPPPPALQRPAPTRPVPVATAPNPTAPPVVVDHSTGPLTPPMPNLPAVAGPAVEAATVAGPATTAPVALRYVQAPPPPYPRAAIRNGLTGTVWLRVLVDESGGPVAVEVEQGSGHRVLDDAARRQVLANWRFQPALDGDQPVQAWGRVPIEFSLER